MGRVAVRRRRRRASGAPPFSPRPSSRALPSLNQFDKIHGVQRRAAAGALRDTGRHHGLTGTWAVGPKRLRIYGRGRQATWRRRRTRGEGRESTRSRRCRLVDCASVAPLNHTPASHTQLDHQPTTETNAVTGPETQRKRAQVRELHSKGKSSLNPPAPPSCSARAPSTNPHHSPPPIWSEQDPAGRAAIAAGRRARAGAR